jgi:hypothetical protein
MGASLTNSGAMVIADRSSALDLFHGWTMVSQNRSVHWD